MNDQEPEWASNMKRGLANYLQINLERVTPQQLMFFKDEEVNCPIMPQIVLTEIRFTDKLLFQSSPQQWACVQQCMK